MSGPTDFAAYPVIATCLVAAATDLAWGRIYNWLTIPMFAAALACALGFAGWSGLGGAVGGAAIAMALYGWMFWLGYMGGGDVKLLMVLGAWGGPAFAAEVALVSVLVGGVMAAALLLSKGALGGASRKIWRLLVTASVPELELEVPKIDRSITMPYGVPIGLAATWVVVASPLAALGMLPW